MGKIIRGHRVVDPPVKAGPVPMSVNHSRPRPRRVTVPSAEKHEKKEFKTKPSPLRKSFLALDLFPPPSADPPETITDPQVEFDVGDMGLTLDGMDFMFDENENWLCPSVQWPSSPHGLADAPFPLPDAPHAMASPLPMVTELPREDDKLLASVRPPISALPEEEPEDILLEKAGLLTTSENEASEDPMPKKIIVTDDVPHHPRVDDLRRLTL
ncbi:hypothetical protein CYLTODRAFT_425157 [Cylindrobasidium torrendii FP15055 ss-10]|uniref:Uncharacterized protein n=1 Tax=Cylindrobasidium torrendii FP15055 ss-10 TaxID=1314674 RepID=A0A0D7B1X6_9AGAR|nr:hypothetical protein CYLTODRAFT_425157 [Cylindrobasidium torrendii FP15055 ss-10]